MSEPLPSPALHRGVDLDAVDLAGDLSGQDGTGAVLLECTLTGCALDGVRLDEARLLDTTVAGGRGSTVSMVRTTWRDGAWCDVRWGAVDVGAGELTRLRVTGGRIDYLALRGAELVDVVLDGCRIDELDLTDATVTRLRTRDVTLRRLVLRGARCRDADLRGASWDSFDGVGGLAGTRLTSGQVMELAEALAGHIGIRVD